MTERFLTTSSNLGSTSMITVYGKSFTSASNCEITRLSLTALAARLDWASEHQIQTTCQLGTSAGLNLHRSKSTNGDTEGD